MIGLTKIRVSLGVGILALTAFARPALGQEECRGWARSCASVDVRVEGEQLIFYSPNMIIETDEPSETEDGSERVTVLPVDSDGAPFATPLATAAAPATGAMDDPGNISCDEDESYLEGGRGIDESDKRRCGRPVGALVLLALPASLFLLAPDGTDEVTVEGPPNQPVSTPGDSPVDDGTGDGAGDGTGGNDGDNSAGNGDSSAGNSGNNGNNGGNNNSGNTGGNSGTTGGDSGGNSGTTGGNSGTTGGSSGHNPDGDDWGPYHPGATPGGAALPPISQVPEPISTTLFGIGLVGYASARLRRRRAGLSDED
ncbi:MAG: PEP-CTERM sorting domain-containing protein [Gemmatimonadota bacterium]